MKNILTAATALALALLCSAPPLFSQTVDITYQGSGIWSYINRMVVEGDHAFCAMNHGLMIIDISDPAQPVEISKYYIEQGAGRDILISGDYAYFCCGSGGLIILDISDIHSPTLVTQYGDGADLICLYGDSAIVTTGSGFDIIDLVDPSAPVKVGGYYDFFFGDPSDIAIRDGLVLFANYGGLAVWDISAPASPVEVAFYPTDHPTRGMAIVDTLAYLITDTAFQIINISDPLTATFIGAGDCPGRDIEVLGDYAVIACPSQNEPPSGLYIYDISDPTAPAAAGYMNQVTYHVNLAGEYICAGNMSSYFDIIDIADPAAPTTLGSHHTPVGDSWGMRNVVTDGRYAYIAYGKGGLVIADISDPAHPVLVNNDLITSRTTNVVLKGQTLYVTTDAYVPEGLIIVDVADPKNPRIVGFYDYSSPQEVVIHGNYALLSGNYGDAYVVDISNRANPTYAGKFRLGGITWGMVAQGNYLYAANYPHYLKTVDISNVNAPVVVDSQYITPQLQDLIIYKDYLLLSVNSAIYIYDIETDPARPHRINSYNIDGKNYRMTPHGDYVFVAAGYPGDVVILDMTDPVFPELAGSQIISGSALGVAVFDQYAYVVDQYGLVVFQCDLPVCCHDAGDVNFDGRFTIGDAVHLLNYIFKDGLPINCRGSADVNGDCIINIGDPVFMINYMARGGPAPACSGCIE